MYLALVNWVCSCVKNGHSTYQKKEWALSDKVVPSSDFCHACYVLYLIVYPFQVMTGGIFVLGPMLSLLEQLTGKLLSLNLLLVPTGEETQINQCSKGFTAQHGRTKNNWKRTFILKRRLNAGITGALDKILIFSPYRYITSQCNGTYLCYYWVPTINSLMWLICNDWYIDWGGECDGF